MKKSLTIYRLDFSITPHRIAGDLSSLGEAVWNNNQSIKSIYFDTFDWRLFAENKSLTVLGSSTGEEIQLFDHTHQELISRAEGSLPTGFVADVADGDLHQHLRAIISVRRMFPCLITTSKIKQISLRNKEGKTILRARLEYIHYRSPKSEKNAPLGAQLTLLAVRGYDKSFKKVKCALDKHYQNAPTSIPIHVIGLEKIGATPGSYSSKFSLRLESKMPSGDAARAIHLALLDAMKLNEQGTSKNLDFEYLHDFRVAVRRTRSALSQIDKGVLPEKIINKAKDDFRWLGQQTNLMRDLDVYLIEYPKLLKILPDSYKGDLVPFQDYLLEQSARESKKIVTLIKGRRYQKIKNHWHTFMKDSQASAKDGADAMTPIKALANRRIWKTYRRLMKEGRAINPQSPAMNLHDLRITGKKLRYLLEFFQSLYSKSKMSELISALKALQNVLGEFQDTEVQSKAILKFGQEMSNAGLAPIKTQMAMGMVAKSVLLRQSLARQEFHDRFDTFSKASIKKAFAQIFNNR